MIEKIWGAKTFFSRKSTRTNCFKTYSFYFTYKCIL